VNSVNQFGANREKTRQRLSRWKNIFHQSRGIARKGDQPAGGGVGSHFPTEGQVGRWAVPKGPKGSHMKEYTLFYLTDQKKRKKREELEKKQIGGGTGIGVKV